jgi:hypothetical protein
VRRTFPRVMPRPWPVIAAVGRFGLAVGLVYWLHTGRYLTLVFGFFTVGLRSGL